MGLCAPRAYRPPCCRKQLFDPSGYGTNTLCAPGVGWIYAVESLLVELVTLGNKTSPPCVQGNCSGPIPKLPDDDILKPELWNLDPGQCLLYTDKVLLNFYGKEESPFEARYHYCTT